MPLYEYKCTACGDRVEILQKMNDPPHAICEQCGAAMKKLFSSPAIQFKGSGFYKTDYAPSAVPVSKGDGASESKSESKSDSKSESKSDSKSDSKSESKSESKADAKGETKSESKSDSKSESRSDTTASTKVVSKASD